MFLWRQSFQIGTMLGWQDVKQAYRRSIVGPFWLTMGMLIQIVTIGTVYGLIFSAPSSDFLPFIATSFVLWTLISSSVTEGSVAFIQAEPIMRQLNLPQFAHVVRVVWRNLIIFLHNFAILPLTYLVFKVELSWSSLLFVPAALLIATLLLMLAYVIGLVTTRFRDVQQIVSSLMVVVFYLTPVIWNPEILPKTAPQEILLWNPVFHILQIIRLPLLGQTPSSLNWVVVLGLSFFCGFATYLVYLKFRNRLTYWL